MGKERMVTRTVVTTNFEVLTCYIDTANTVKQNVILPGDWTKETNIAKILKEIRKVYETEVIKVVVILNKGNTDETLYGMPETEFIANAVVLPPRFTKEA